MLRDCLVCSFFFKQKTAYEMRISDWSSDVCSSDLPKMDARIAAHHDDLVRERRNVGASRRATAEHRRNLRQTGCRHVGLAEERIAEMPGIGEDTVLLGQVGSAAINEVKTGQTVFRRDLLRTHMLLNGFVVK